MNLALKNQDSRKNIFSRLTKRRKAIAIFSIFLISLFIITKTYESTTYAFLTYSANTSRPEATDHAVPTFINIPSLGIELPIDETSISNGFWGITESGASHLTSSPVPGELGNTVIYAKNSPSQFGRLNSLEHGDTITIITKDGIAHEYEVTETKVVSPADSELINNTGIEVVTLYTSYGFGNLKRFVVRAEPLL